MWITTWCSEKISSILYHTKPPNISNFPQNNELCDKLYMNSAIWYRITFFFPVALTKIFPLGCLEFFCKPWQCFWSTWKHHTPYYSPQIHVILFNLPWKFKTNVKASLFLFIIQMCNSTFIENFMFKFSSQYESMFS